jgi:tRNA nucleotidyltransferase (CCA-adding enzyme)
MNIESQLREKLRKIEALFAGAGTAGERAPKDFVDHVLWPEFAELDRALQIYLHEVTLRVISEEVYSDTSEAQEVPEALSPSSRSA